jgi:hypothetical protein
MTKASRGAYTPGAQGYSLAEAIDGLAPTGVNGDDSRDPPPVKCRWKGCPTILNTLNRPGRKPRPKVEEPEEKSEEEPGLDQSGIRESVPPEELGSTPAPDPPPKKAGKKKGKKGHVPSRKYSKEGLCFPHQQAVNFFEMGLEDVVPVFEDDPVAPEPAEEPAKPEPAPEPEPEPAPEPEPETPTDTLTP